MKLSDYKKVHCIGVGGIGLSALARYCNVHGATVSGSDASASRITDDIQKEGIQVYIGNSASYIDEGVDLVVYTIAVTDTNEELAAARARDITCLTYPEALGLLTQEYSTIAVCGTHGKTTTTAMIANMLSACGESPTVIVGSLFSNGGTNFIQGTGNYLVVEACEYRRSFLNLHPTHVVVTNIDADHLDYYKDMDDIKSAFQSFTDKIPGNGSLITHNDIELVTSAKKVNADIIDATEIKLSVPGVHNRHNAQLALALAQELGLDEENARKGLYDFTGTWRRLEYKGEYKGAKLYDDYGHHPTEIKATLQALREAYPEGKFRLITIFQPHLFSRTKLLLDEFAHSFGVSDVTYMLPIYASREAFDESISSLDLVEKTHGAVYAESFEEVKKEIDTKYHRGCVVLTIGAGDVYKLHEMLQ